jgi:hypothetical protein
MVNYTTRILKFGDQGEKTGWTYVEVPVDIAQKLMPVNKKAFRVKGKLDDFEIDRVAIMPMGNGDFILVINAEMRKGIRKKHGAMLELNLEVDTRKIPINEELLMCLEDEPEAIAFFKSLSNSHQSYFSKWVDGAKTEETKAKRIALRATASKI